MCTHVQRMCIVCKSNTFENYNVCLKCLIVDFPTMGECVHCGLIDRVRFNTLDGMKCHSCIKNPNWCLWNSPNGKAKIPREFLRMYHCKVSPIDYVMAREHAEKNNFYGWKD